MKLNTIKTMTAAAALILVAGAAHVTSGAELQESCQQPPATVIEMTGINTSHARARAKYTEPDIIKACHEGYVYQRGWSPEECITQTKLDLLGNEISAEANCAQGTLRLQGFGNLLFKMPVHGDCATGGIFAVPTFKMLCPQYQGRIEKPLSSAAQSEGKAAQSEGKNAVVAAAIRGAGFDCKRVYAAAPLNGSPYGEGLSVGCDSTVPGIRYVFRMVDYGGRWLVTPVQRLQGGR